MRQELSIVSSGLNAPDVKDGAHSTSLRVQTSLPASRAQISDREVIDLTMDNVDDGGSSDGKVIVLTDNMSDNDSNIEIVSCSFFIDLTHM